MFSMISYLGGTGPSGGALPQVVSPAFPLPVTLSGGLSGLQVSGVTPVGVIATTNPVLVGGVDVTGAARDLLTDGSGVLQVSATIAGGNTVQQGTGNTGNPWTVQGPAASGLNLSGNPVRMGGAFNTTPPTVANGQVVDLQASANGVLLSAGATIAGVTLTTATNPGLVTISNNGSFQTGMSRLFISNGSTWDALIKPRAAFRLPSSAATNNAANIKSTPGTVFSISGQVLTTGAPAYLKLFDTTTAPNPAALTPLYMFPLTFTAGNTGIFTFNLPAQGIYFPTGIGVAIVAGAADLDNTAIAAAQIAALNITFN